MLDWFESQYMSLSAHPLGVFGPVLEVLMLWGIIYVVLLFMRGTRGAGILRGMLLLYALGIMVILAVAQFAQLENIRWIVENLLGIAIIAAVVVFQPEIRRALIRIGETPVWNLFNSDKSNVLGEVVKAVEIMSRKSVGAIIVIERETRLGGYIEGGVRIDAAVNSELLCTIFHPKTPLHDGAVIIRKGRLVAANCLLPFTENIEVCRGMGARHRAGIGLSEESDALIVIVSEETGRISVAFKSKIQQGLDSGQLQAILAENCAYEIEGTLIKEDAE